MPHLSGLAERRLSRIFRDTILPSIQIHQPYWARAAEKGVGPQTRGSFDSLAALSTWLNAAGLPNDENAAGGPCGRGC